MLRQITEKKEEKKTRAATTKTARKTKETRKKRISLAPDRKEKGMARETINESPWLLEEKIATLFSLQ